MLVRDCMTKDVEIADPRMSLQLAARMMSRGDFGVLPVGEKDRLIGVLTDRDITTRAVAEGKDPKQTKVREVMSDKVLYCYEDESTEDVARNMGDNQVRRLPVVNREKRLVGIISLGDISKSESDPEHAEEALSRISRHEHHEPQSPGAYT